jgi:acetolactate synthase small subunit
MWFNTRKQVIEIIVRQTLIAIAAIILALGISIFASRAILKISNSLQEKTRLSKMLTMRVENIQQLKKSLALLGENDKKIIAIYPPTDDILDFVSATESIAKQNSLKQTLRFGDFMSAADTGIVSISRTDYTINLNGTITTLKAYLEQLEKIQFVAKIGSVNLLAAPPNGWNGDSTITINGSLYAQQTQ